MTSQDSKFENLDQNNKNLGRRPCAPIWSFFIEGEEIDPGHRSVTCKCSVSWKRESANKSAEDIRKVLYDADLYEEADNITFEQAIMDANIDQSSIDDDNDVVSEKFFELEKTLDLSNSSFLSEASRQTEVDVANDDAFEVDSNDWLEEFNQEEDYDPAELEEMFIN
ncbi:2995_t:CDS:2 [Scutellospora calospora]|uniref:2995_t:CDS:1 n=1 Tax=Scutellospora calospora TaxID=85575 RepID=A0ACA9LJ61_9GLOM|nr:2995_t:CDS:2 [Scutellospora calospora]